MATSENCAFGVVVRLLQPAILSYTRRTHTLCILVALVSCISARFVWREEYACAAQHTVAQSCKVARNRRRASRELAFALYARVRSPPALFARETPNSFVFVRQTKPPVFKFIAAYHIRLILRRLCRENASTCCSLKTS